MEQIEPPSNTAVNQVNFQSCALVILSTLAITACSSTHPNIQGTWKHSEKPAWVEIVFDEQIGSAQISRHDENPDAAGESILEQIARNSSTSNTWFAKIYSAEENGYVDATLVLNEEDELIVRVTSPEEGFTEVLRLMRNIGQ